MTDKFWATGRVSLARDRRYTRRPPRPPPRPGKGPAAQPSSPAHRSGRPLRVTLVRPLDCLASAHVTSSSATRFSRSARTTPCRVRAVTGRGHDLVPAVQLHDAPPAGWPRLHHQRRCREIAFAHQPRHVISVDAISPGHVRLVQKTVFHVLAHHLISGAIELHRVSTVVPNFYRGSMSSGPWKSKTTGDGLEFRSSLFKMLDEKHFEEMPGVELAAPPGASRLVPLSVIVPYGRSRTWQPDACVGRSVSCSSFHRAETYMLTDGTATVERPRDAAPAQPIAGTDLVRHSNGRPARRGNPGRSPPAPGQEKSLIRPAAAAKPPCCRQRHRRAILAGTWPNRCSPPAASVSN